MRILLKIIAAPLVVVLTVLWLVLNFLFAIASTFLIIICVIGVMMSIAFFIFKQTTGGIIFLTISYLISPFGLPLAANWLIEKVGELNFALRDFMTS